MADDPWDWDTARVIQELCSEQRSWKTRVLPHKRPDPQELGAKITELDLDGQSLLWFPYTSSMEVLFENLGIKKIPHKIFLGDAIKALQDRSAGFQLATEASPEPTQDVAMSGTPDVPTPVSAPTPVDPALVDSALALPAPADPTPTDNAPASPTRAVEEEHPPKKRRLAPTLISDVPVHAQPVVFETMADTVTVVPATAHVKLAASKPSGIVRYYGDELHDFDSRASDDDTSGGEFSFSAGRSDQVAPGYRIWLGRRMTRHLRPFHQRNRPRLTKLAAVKALETDDEFDEVISLSGDYDEEDDYDDETRAEIDKELEERRLLEEQQAKAAEAKAFTQEDRKRVVESVISELEEEWRQSKLPKLEATANKVWNSARRNKNRTAEIESARRTADHLDSRLNDWCKRIWEDPTQTESDIRGLGAALECTVFDKASSQWKIGLLASPLEPKKLQPSSTRLQRPKPPKVRKVVENDSDVDVLTSDSEDDGLASFVVNDEEDAELAPGQAAHLLASTDANGYSSENGSAVRQPDVDDANNTMAMDLDGTVMTPDGPEAHAKDSHGDRMAVNDPGVKAEPELEEAPDNGLEPPTTPARPTGMTPDVIDLTGIEDSPALIGGSALIAHTAPETPTRATSSVVGFPKSSPKAIASMGGEYWRDHERPKELVITFFYELNYALRQAILDAVEEMNPDELWELAVLPCCVGPDGDGVVSGCVINVRAAIALSRLFDVYNLLKLKVARCIGAHLKSKLVKRIKARRGKFEGYCIFMRSLRGYFPKMEVSSAEATTPAQNAASQASQPSQVDVEPDPPAAQDSADDSDGLVILSAKKKRRKRDEQAKNLRKTDRLRLEELEERRAKLHQQLALSGAVSGVTRLIINEAKEESQGFIYVTERIAPYIKDHQIQGVRFMWNQVVNDSKTTQGCLLAHSMGLGKTMQVICLLVAIAEASKSEYVTVSSQIPEELRESKTLVLCPAGLVRNWCDELVKWAPPQTLGKTYRVESKDDAVSRSQMIVQWAEDGGVLVIGYDLFKKLNDEDGELMRDRAHIVVGDEAHVMKNQKSLVSQATSNFRTKARIAMTGSPLANSVLDYYSAINWVAPNYLGPREEFEQLYANPIQEGLFIDSSEAGKRRSHKLLKALDRIVSPKTHRMTIQALKDQLPPKKEFVLFVAPTKLQEQLYQGFLSLSSRSEGRSVMADIFSRVHTLSLLLSHPDALRTHLKQMREAHQKGGTVELIDGESASDAKQPKSSLLPPQVVEDLIKMVNTAGEPRNRLDPQDTSQSTKIVILLGILEEAKKAGDKVLIFSHRKLTISYLANLFGSMNKSYCVLDGQTQTEKRHGMINEFNKDKTEVFLIATRAGGIGLNIQGANRVVIMDFEFTPLHEAQAIGRAYRIGQQRPVFVYWLVVVGTYQTKLLDLNVFKSQLAYRVVDKMNVRSSTSRYKGLFQPPEPVAQEDLSHARGKDAVLDAVLSSQTEGQIRKIVMGDAFEEEEPELKLSEEDLKEADGLVAKNRLLHTNPDEYNRLYGSSNLSLGPGVPTHWRTSMTSGAVSVAQAGGSAGLGHGIHYPGIVGNGTISTGTLTPVIALSNAQATVVPKAPLVVHPPVRPSTELNGLAGAAPGPPLPPLRIHASTAAGVGVVPPRNLLNINSTQPGFAYSPSGHYVPNPPSLLGFPVAPGIPIRGVNTDFRAEPDPAPPTAADANAHPSVCTAEKVMAIFRQSAIGSSLVDGQHESDLHRISADISSALLNSKVQGMPARARVQKLGKAIADNAVDLHALMTGKLKVGEEVMKAEYGPNGSSNAAEAGQPGDLPQPQPQPQPPPTQDPSHRTMNMIPHKPTQTPSSTNHTPLAANLPSQVGGAAPNPQPPGADGRAKKERKREKRREKRQRAQNVKRERLPSWAYEAVRQGDGSGSVTPSPRMGYSVALGQPDHHQQEQPLQQQQQQPVQQQPPRPLVQPVQRAPSREQLPNTPSREQQLVVPGASLDSPWILD